MHIKYSFKCFSEFNLVLIIFNNSSIFLTFSISDLLISKALISNNIS